MKQFTLFISLFMTLCFCACSDEKGEEERTGNGLSEQSWATDEAIEATVDTPTSISFKAKDKWVASANSTWFSVSPKSGAAGNHTLTITVSSTSTYDRSGSVTLNVNGYSPSTFTITQKGTGIPDNPYAGLNEKVDAYLQEMYLWNDEYKTLTPDFNQDYDIFLSSTLLSMKTNTMDKRTNSAGTTYTFSYIRKKSDISSTRATKYIDKELEYSFGITGVTPVNIESLGICFNVQGVYPDSPAAEAGIKRGFLFNKINGQSITEDNWPEWYYTLLAPSSASSIKLTNALDATESYTITSKAMYLNPVIKCDVEEVDGKKLGYLVYDGFDASFDEELFDSIKSLKQESITDLILDLRYNGGGHVISANLIASCVAGAPCQEQDFIQYRFNDTRMKTQYNNERPNDKFAYNKYGNLGISLAEGDLGLSRLYCLVGSGTASASELVINSLKGIDIEVILIGEQTTGKNVGMEPEDIDFDGATYELAPITFQCYNAKGYGDYQAGFKPDYILDETNPESLERVYYVHRDYGRYDEPLYAKAYELITGKKPTADEGTTRSAETSLQVQGKLRTPTIPYRPGHSGIIKLNNE